MTPSSSQATARPAAPSADTASSPTALWRARSAAGAPDAVWVPVSSGVLILVAGALSLATGKPWLFAALGPTAAMIAGTPGHSTTRFQAIVLGHLAGLLCGWLAVLLLGAGDSASLLSGKAVPVVRVWASALAVALTVLVQPSLRAWHPPAAATALLVTLGAHRLSWKTALTLLGSVLVVAALGEWLQRVRIAATRDGARAGARA